MKKIITLIFLCIISLCQIYAKITWTLSDDGTLTISGTNMPDYYFEKLPEKYDPDYDSNIPWYSQRNKIKKNVIEEGVTNIGKLAFYNCSSLTSITIPESVTSIGQQGFEECSSLALITIPESVTSIGSSAFYGNKGLTSITIPKSVTSIGGSAFCGCIGLTSITISEGVTSIGSYAFSGCSSLTSITIPRSVEDIQASAFSSCPALTSITVESGNKVYDNRNNCNAIIETLNNGLIVGCKKTVIPNNVESICASAFSGCKDLTSIVIPNSVTSIGAYAFYGCI